MDRWSGLLKVPVFSKSNSFCRVAASLCLSPSSKRLIIPSANVIFFNGDRVNGTRNPVIERLSDLEKIAEIMVSKFNSQKINAWVIEASKFNGPFAVYKEFTPSANSLGEPASYNPIGFPASKSIVSLLLNALQEAKNIISDAKEQEQEQKSSIPSLLLEPKSILLGFSKGGIVINQVLTELSTVSKSESREESFLRNIAEIHYVDVGLNCGGAYITDSDVIRGVGERSCLRLVVHGTPRQWRDKNRVWIREEKERMMEMLGREGKLEVLERFYFGDRSGDLVMHFQIIECLDVG